MSRRKNAKRTPKRVKANDFAAMHKAFHDAPTKLAARLNKEVAQLKTKEMKLKNALNKVNAQSKKAEMRMTEAGNVRNMQMRKKKMAKAKKSQTQLKLLQMTVGKQLHETSKMLQEMAAGVTKFNALRKLLNQFEKDWKNQSAKPAQAKARNKKSQRKAKANVTPLVPVEEKKAATNANYEIFSNEQEESEKEPVEVAS